MTDDEALRAVGTLAGGLNGFTSTHVDEFHAQFLKLDDPDSLLEVCQDYVRTNANVRPSVGDVVSHYHQHPQVRAAREARIAEAMLDESVGAEVVSFSEGWAIANDAYKARYGRNIGEAPVPNPEFAETLIINQKRRDRNGDWHAMYTDVLHGFRDDQARASASLDAIGRRLTRSNGHLVLRPPDEPYAPPAPPQAAPPPSPPERTSDASGLLSEAIGVTISRMEGQ